MVCHSRKSLQSFMMFKLECRGKIVILKSRFLCTFKQITWYSKNFSLPCPEINLWKNQKLKILKFYAFSCDILGIIYVASKYLSLHSILITIVTLYVKQWQIYIIRNVPRYINLSSKGNKSSHSKSLSSSVQHYINYLRMNLTICYTRDSL